MRTIAIRLDVQGTNNTVNNSNTSTNNSQNSINNAVRLEL